MKLNVKCVRSILLEMEKQPLNEPLSFNALRKRLSGYDKDEVQYSCFKLYEAGYIDALKIDVDNLPTPLFPYLNDITFAGHEFLNKVRDDTVFQKALGVAEKAGAFSLEIVSQAATAVLTQWINGKFGM